MDDARPGLVLDTNVVLDWLVFRDARVRRIAAAIDEGTLRLITSAACIEELQRALGYAAIKLDAAAQAQACQRYLATTECFDVPAAGTQGTLPACEDRDDQKFLDLAWHAGARWLVSRDRALLKLANQVAKLGRFTVLAPDELESALSATRGQ
jgi:uncharacterized protein